MVALLVLFMVAAVLGIDWAVRAYRRSRGMAFAPFAPVLPLPDWAKLPLEKLAAPAGLFYGRGHTWMQLRDDGALRIGIDDFLNHAVGPVEKLEFLEIGAQVKRGEPLAKLKQHDIAVWVRSPISGRIKSAHRDVVPQALRQDPYGQGWLVELEPEGKTPDLSGLRLGTKVMDWFRDEALRYGRFLIALQPAPAWPTLQDGGTPVEERLMALGPERAAQFERSFLRFPEEA
jgi:glycine cleavage system H protein